MRASQALLWLKSNASVLSAKDYSRFLVASDGAGWVLDEEGKEILRVAKTLGIRGRTVFKPLSFLKQSVHYTSHFSLLDPTVFNTHHRISVDYFHGKPEQGKEFAEIYNVIQKRHSRLSRIRVSYSEMERLVLTTGIDPAKVIRIPIGINPDYFTLQTKESRQNVRGEFGIPNEAVVIGSFQKDGTGWGVGDAPKTIKGPDIFLQTLEQLKKQIPDVYVLLTGPARGFVKKGLDRLGIRYKHFMLDQYSQIGKYYHALDAYIVSSREEGGPKAVLESMVSGIPIISTHVGQAIDLIENGRNGYRVDVEDVKALCDRTLEFLSLDKGKKDLILKKAYETAKQNTYSAQAPLWKKFFKGLVVIT